MNLDLVFSRTLFSQTVLENGEEINPNDEIHIKLSKYANHQKAYVGDIITLSIYMMNYSDTTITNLMLCPEVIPAQAQFIPNSLTVDDQVISSDTFPTTPITLPALMPRSAVLVTYQVQFTTIPSVSKLEENLCIPLLNNQQ